METKPESVMAIFIIFMRAWFLFSIYATGRELAMYEQRMGNNHG